MLTLDEFRSFLKDQLQKDQQKKSIQVSGATVEEALNEAAVELGLPVSRLEYEVLDPGKKGFMGVKQRNCLLVVYPSEKVVKKVKEETAEEEYFESYQESEYVEPDLDGVFSVRLSPDGAFVKVFPPHNKGRVVEIGEVIDVLHDRAVHDIDQAILKEAVERQDGLPVKVGDFIYNPANDPLMKVIVSDDELECFLVVSPPGPGGSDLTTEDLSNFLASNGIEFGLDMKAIRDFEDFPVYSEPYLVAVGTKPINGNDARIIYNFDTDPKGKVKINPDGSVDFKELNKIQNVVKGQPLAKKIPPEAGKDGRTIYGRYLPAKDGKDVEIGLGKNVTITDNGNTVVASVSGQVLLVKGKINVETVLVIPGNIDSSTGNVSGLGSVVIKGNVEDGFTVKAQGTIEVAGYVGRSNLFAGQDIIVKKGINGGDDKEYGHIIAGGSLWASFAQNATIETGDLCVVSDGIVNSQITAKRKILSKGKRSKIVGGVIKASEEINATTYGSEGGVETILEVGYDPKTKEELDNLENNLQALIQEQEDIDRNIQGIIKQKKRSRAKLSNEKEQLFLDLRVRHNDLIGEIKILTEEITKRKDYLDSLKKQGKICASKNVHSGVKVHIREAVYEVTTPYDSPVTFILENGYIKTTAYEAIEEDLSRPDAE